MVVPLHQERKEKTVSENRDNPCVSKVFMNRSVNLSPYGVVRHEIYDLERL